MVIALHNSDKTKFPSLPLMKLSAYYKSQGYKVLTYMPILRDTYDIIYSAKVFSWYPNDSTLPSKTIKGGTGYKTMVTLPDEIEHIKPDYSMYPNFNAALGFTTRGCIRNCQWCIVPKKEGKIYAHADIEEFLRHDCNNVVLMDNNILAHEHGVKQIEKSIRLKLKIDCNQGLDARLIAADAILAKLLSKVHWIKGIRLACDTNEQMKDIEKAVKTIRKYGNKKYVFSCYVLVKDIDDALERVEFLRKLEVKPFAQPYRDLDNYTEPAKETKDFARWVNHKAIFNTVKWHDYKHIHSTKTYSRQLFL